MCNGSSPWTGRGSCHKGKTRLQRRAKTGYLEAHLRFWVNRDAKLWHWVHKRFHCSRFVHAISLSSRQPVVQFVSKRFAHHARLARALQRLSARAQAPGPQPDACRCPHWGKCHPSPGAADHGQLTGSHGRELSTLETCFMRTVLIRVVKAAVRCGHTSGGDLNVMSWPINNHGRTHRWPSEAEDSVVGLPPRACGETSLSFLFLQLRVRHRVLT